ncbi:MAG: hypothetical protein K8R41_04680 [Bacteroidales bacterium]|nr:hypothetical protein [Bacteroidales bacterium]
MIKNIGRLISIIGIVFFLNWIKDMATLIYFQNNAVVVEAKIIDYQERKIYGNYYRSKIECSYINSKGEEVIIDFDCGNYEQNKLDCNWYICGNVGDTIVLRYLPSERFNFLLERHNHQQIPCKYISWYDFVIMFIGIGFFLFGLIISRMFNFSSKY